MFSILKTIHSTFSLSNNNKNNVGKRHFEAATDFFTMLVFCKIYPITDFRQL